MNKECQCLVPLKDKNYSICLKCNEQLSTSPTKGEVIIKRSLMFIPFAVIVLVQIVFMYLKYLVNFIRYGGEAIVYTDSQERRTIGDIYETLKKNS